MIVQLSGLEGSRVRFNAGQGWVEATWHGEAGAPAKGVDIEISVSECEWGVDVIKLDEGGVSGIWPDGTIRGTAVEGLRGTLVLQVNDGLVLVGTRGQPPEHVKGSTIELTSVNIEIYPTGI